ncbi:hypothetical protein A2291_04155 [candidate division WOR-1 bacterium RIFOXYB2_FULL_42_35]|uniref:SLH domain-containing protein n=1 Tax=candidate division WOR-1 bacterium RIFOXYC2_FULL_41_25 TaxID=1802586 RepID=A0A1F4TMW2_UNCSA|nr:MAG: hypothetical protein A2247_00995 [candidate division WOR-1 bacterium RIFOXYA2_FULL_41_14]OGC24324.1 MAG: hypothetical protein A2291_04155 [candidate division WOR-1 bacterium RIFOXYB2_FULL_42_35]OGC34026.1 MAG: hypothetical protein A2462_01560 [candidate division WOR-1 bacterium RIFOXYC2_FULL_41_25]OGC42341.1 MAG: hypothetical protein A2548_07270 [candidate division WOR-1 bacterium RIFOXYD2_FULL_41_8]
MNKNKSKSNDQRKKIKISSTDKDQRSKCFGFGILILGFILIFSFGILSLTSGADVEFKDMDDDMWAANEVYDMVKLGVINGFPDGTFRGTENVNRYEIAVMLSKLKNVLGGDLQADVVDLKTKIVALEQAEKEKFEVSGSLKSSMAVGNLLATGGAVRGGLAGYRLILTTTRRFSPTAKVVVNLDTMDYGFENSASPDLAKQLIDVTSVVGLDMSIFGLENPVDLTVSYGPGAVRQTSSYGGVFPSLVGVVYSRPDTGVMAETKLWGADVAGSYIVMGRDANNLFDVTRFTGSVGYQFNNVPLVNTLKVETAGDYVSAGIFSDKTRDIRGAIALSAPLGNKIEASGKFGMAGTGLTTLMFGGSLALKDVFDTGTVANIKFFKVGQDYINATFAAAEFDFAGLDVFDRPLQNGTVNFGGDVTQQVTEDIKLIGKGQIRLNPDYRYDTTVGRLTAQGGVSYAVAPSASLDALYRIDQDRSTGDTTDMAAVGLLYKF